MSDDKNKHSRRSKSSKLTTPPVQERINAENDAKAKKANGFSNITTKLRDPMWQSIGVLVTVVLFLISILLTLNVEKKLEPLAIPDNFVSFSNSDFALSLPYTVNQNNSFSTRSYGFILDKSEKNSGVLLITIFEGNALQPEPNSDSYEFITLSNETLST